MGFESFRVQLRGGSVGFEELDRWLQKLPGARPDPGAVAVPGSTYYLSDDGRHVLEMELRDSPARLSCRFTLCHPSSVDAALFGLVRDLMTRLGMEARIDDDAPTNDTRWYSRQEYPAFYAATSHAISVRRAEWVAAFGPEPLAATTHQVHERVIWPRCLPAGPPSPERQAVNPGSTGG